MFGLETDYYKNPVGSINIEKTQEFNTPWRKSEVNFFNKHHKSQHYYNDGINIIPHYNKKYNTSIAVNQLENINYNSTIGQTYYEEHQTNKHLNNMRDISKHKFNNGEGFKNTLIVDEINEMRKNKKVFVVPPNASHKLKEIKK